MESNKCYIFCVCVIQHTKCMWHIVACGLLGCTIFFHIISQTARFKNKKVIIHKICVLISLQLLSQAFPIFRRIQWDVIINLHKFSCKAPIILVILIKLDFLDRLLKNSQILNIMKICLVGGVLCGQTGKWADTMKLIVAFCKFASTPKNCQMCVCVCVYVCLCVCVCVCVHMCICVCMH
jgi:hypothetical protein